MSVCSNRLERRHLPPPDRLPLLEHTPSARPLTPSPPTLRSPHQLIVLSSIQVYAYAVMCLFLPVLWFYPSVDLIFRLQGGIFNDVSTNQKLSAALALLNLSLLVAALWLALFWHATIALSLYSLIVRQDSPATIQSRLRPALDIAVFLMMVKLAFDLIACVYPSAVNLQIYSASFLFSLLFLIVLGAYGATVLSLLRRSGAHPVLRSVSHACPIQVMTM